MIEEGKNDGLPLRLSIRNPFEENPFACGISGQ